MSDFSHGTTSDLLERSGLISSNVHPDLLAYRGVLIERPCVNCDTVDIHFKGRCNFGPCQFVEDGKKCGEARYTNTRYSGTWGHDSSHEHKWVAATYYPADFEFPPRTIHNFGYIRSDAEKAFDAILDCVKREGLPQHYTSDLFRDYQILTGQGIYGPPPVRFIWAVRSTGSDLYTPEIGMRYVTNERYFAYDGKTHGPLGDFVEVNIDTARTLLSVWRQVEMVGVSPETLIEGYPSTPEDAAVYAGAVFTNLTARPEDCAPQEYQP